MNVFGERLKELRQENGIGQVELAKKNKCKQGHNQLLGKRLARTYYEQSHFSCRFFRRNFGLPRRQGMNVQTALPCQAQTENSFC